MLIYYFSFFNEKSARRQLIKKLPKRGCKLIIPDFAMEELMGDKERIKEFARINELEFSRWLYPTIPQFGLIKKRSKNNPESKCSQLLI
jgi:hypothetical protein